jgi:type II secretory pathway pseudopilin PulG
MKKAFSLLELVLVVVLIGFLYTLFIPKKQENRLQELTNRVSLYLSYIRYKALIDDKYLNDDLWHKKRWTMKFFRCQNEGIYFSIYSDENGKGHPNQDESLKDPLTNKYIYSSNYCEENNENSKYTLLTKSFDIDKVNISCNDTDSLGQISFGNDGRVYSKLSNFSNEAYEYEITTPCYIKFTSKNQETKEIKIYPKTAFIE